MSKEVAAAAGATTRLSRKQWTTLLAANMGWMFDGYETYALILVVGVALKQLLTPAQLPHLPFYAGALIAITLVGWGVGGILGGILADYIGRRRAMIVAIITYSLLTGLSAIAWSWTSLAVLRFLVGLGLGSEWGTGTAIVAEVWPDHMRAKGAGMMQSGLGIGFFIASAVWYFVGGAGPGAWRYMFLLGILPGLGALWVMSRVEESERWQAADQARRRARARRQGGAVLSEEEARYARFTLSDLWLDRRLRRLTVLASLMSLTTTLGWWGISSWVPAYVGSLAAHLHLSPTHYASIAGMLYNLGAIAGYVSLGFIADAIGRRKTALLYFAASLVLTPILFLWLHNLSWVLAATIVNGFFTLGQYTWMPVWLPEVYPTRIRGTGVAFVFNVARFVAFLGPLLSGFIIARLGGYGIAATSVGMIYLLGIVVAFFFPETKGKPLPE